MTQTDEPRRMLREALADLRTLARRKSRPTRYEARAVLVGLGLLVLAEGEAAAREWLGELTVARAPFEEAFARAAAEELSLAAAEHVRSVDPRFLDHPRYDLAYTVAARERLEARLIAAVLLELEVGEALLEQVAGADRLLEPLLRDEPEQPSAAQGGKPA
jgi:hypothetical protein